MQRISGIFVILIACSAWLAAPPAHADVEAGLVAFQAGDFDTAHDEWKPLAEAGNATAQLNLGLLYFQGKGVEADHEAAAGWYRKAAEHGSVQAQYLLANLYEAGDGVEIDMIKAHTWFNLAADAKYQDSKKRRKRLAKQMTPHQIAYAELHAREFRRKAREAGQ